jgi:hypothetical protein
MQKATFAITIPHFFLPKSAYISEANQESSIQSTTSRFCVHETFQIQQSNFFIYNNAFVQVL